MLNDYTRAPAYEKYDTDLGNDLEDMEHAGRLGGTRLQMQLLWFRKAMCRFFHTGGVKIKKHGLEQS